MTQAYCPCGGIILADTEEWSIPLCNGCYEDIGCPMHEPRFMRELTKQAVDKD